MRAARFRGSSGYVEILRCAQDDSCGELGAVSSA